jgi:hypothetical protein
LLFILAEVTILQSYYIVANSKHTVSLNMSGLSLVAALCVLLTLRGDSVHAYSSSGFLGQPLKLAQSTLDALQGRNGAASLEMRKQKASDKRTRRQQRGDSVYPEDLLTGAITASPMNGKSWSHKQSHPSMALPVASSGGRGRSRKRSALYNSLSLYHNKFLSLLTQEYKQEVSLVGSSW